MPGSETKKARDRERMQKKRAKAKQNTENLRRALVRLISHVEAHGLREGPPPAGDTWPGLDWFKMEVSKL